MPKQKEKSKREAGPRDSDLAALTATFWRNETQNANHVVIM